MHEQSGSFSRLTNPDMLCALAYQNGVLPMEGIPDFMLHHKKMLKSTKTLASNHEWQTIGLTQASPSL